ncbi:MAG: hypothetical protein KDC52_03395 [Ignavibacteriae bacterium]|nr:hypothetical protein [Ignavibacteriota bacterium]
MKSKIFTAVLLFFYVSIINAQFDKLRPNEGYFGGGFGMTWIDDKPHYSFHLFPEVAFANIGIGLDLNLEFDASGKLRSENFNEFSDYLSIIRYVRYGLKNDPFYARLGALDYATLGHGSIMYMYNNRPSFDARKIGLELDIDFTTFGFETVYGSFGESGVAGLRGYIRPLLLTTLADVPVIGNLELGASFVSDFNEYAGVTSGEIDPQTNKFNATNDEGSVSVIGFDIGLPIIRSGIFGFDLYFDYAQIIDYGSGTALGGIFNFSGMGLVEARAKLERRFNGDDYIPSYFNSFYEIERFQVIPESDAVTSKIQILQNGINVGNGYYGELLISFINSFYVFGSYQRLDDDPKSGILNLRADISPEGGSYVARAGYDKINIQDEKDLFTLDNRSYLFTEVGYKPSPYILVSIVYNWTFKPIRDINDNIIEYKPQKRIEPRISFIYPFDL